MFAFMAAKPSYDESAQEKKRVITFNGGVAYFEKNNAWELVELPPSCEAIGVKLVYKIKHDPNGSSQKCKVRLI